MFLQDLETRFGPRDKEYAILGIELLLEANTAPHTWFPPSHPDRKHVVIHLSSGALNSFEQARWQLAHECVHLLNPHVFRTEPTSNLEEGLARWYQDTVVTSRFSEPDVYASAAQVVGRLLQAEPGAIRRLRVEHRQRLSHPTEHALRATCANLTADEVRFLCQRFGS